MCIRCAEYGILILHAPATVQPRCTSLIATLVIPPRPSFMRDFPCFEQACLQFGGNNCSSCSFSNLMLRALETRMDGNLADLRHLRCFLDELRWALNLWHNSHLDYSYSVRRLLSSETFLAQFYRTRLESQRMAQACIIYSDLFFKFADFARSPSSLRQLLFRSRCVGLYACFMIVPS